MKNQIVAKILYEIADLLELKGVEFKPYAYRRAAQTVESLSKDIEEVYKEGKLEDLPGIGKNIAKKISEIIETGSLKYYEDLKKDMPIDFEALLSVEGLGPKKVKTLYKKLKIRNLDDLEKAAKSGKIKNLPGFGEKTEREILENIEFARKSKERMLLGYALPIADEIENRLKRLKEIKKISVAGSLRRMKETIGDLDILIVSTNPSKVMDFFTKMNDVQDILAKGPTKSSIRLKSGLQVDIRVVDEKSFGSALLYFTGSKEHNIALRKIAIEKKMKLSEYGLFKGNIQIAGKTEEEVYKRLGMDFIEPEMRENSGEIDAAMKHSLPKLINYNDIKGDLQIHSKWSDGSNSIEEIALQAKKIGYEYICITDHTGTLKIAHGLDEKKIEKQMKEIESINKKIDGIKILCGAEVNIKADGSLDIKDDILKKLDIVIAAIHSGFKNDKRFMTNRILKAMENRYVDIIAHPTGRMIQKRRAYDIDIEKLFEKSKETNTILEIDSQPDRLDLNDINARAAIEYGCKLVINTDAHNIDHLRFMRLGIATARRAWAQKKDIINTNSLNKLLKFFEK
ncbi:MAG: DNA polymerase/3'-5' exonuclease PolX [Candidatus Aenigmatarchaeota archaeon]